jgi:hypothetical protein
MHSNSLRNRQWILHISVISELAYVVLLSENEYADEDSLTVASAKMKSSRAKIANLRIARIAPAALLSVL